MGRPRKNPYRDFLLSMADHWTPEQVADAIEAVMTTGNVQEFVLGLAEKPQKPRTFQTPGNVPIAPQRPVEEQLCPVCKFQPAEVETSGGPMCVECAAEISTAQKEEEPEGDRQPTE